MITMKITVILCTYNRCLTLAKALDSVAASTLPRSVEWDVLVVDNNSHDQTRKVVEDFCQQSPGRFRYLFETKQGKSHALNSGIREARGDVLAFTDDDVAVEPTWLQNLTAGLHNGEWAGAGGRVLAQQTFSPPPWLPLDGPYSMRGMLAMFDLGDKQGRLDQPPFGNNMAFLKSMFEKHGGFRTDMGPCPGSEIRNEDTEFGRRLLAAGERLRYEPSAIVYHAVPENRLSKPYFLAFWFDHGRASIRELGKKPDIWGIPRRYLTLLKIGALLLQRTLRWLLTLNRKRRFYFKGFAWMTAGEIVEIYRQLISTEKQKHPGVPKTHRDAQDVVIEE